MRKAGWWVAWVLLLGAWIGLAMYLIVSADKPLCPPTENVMLKIAQNNGATEVGVVYLNFTAAKVARDGIDIWLHQHGQCP